MAGYFGAYFSFTDIEVCRHEPWILHQEEAFTLCAPRGFGLYLHRHINCRVRSKSGAQRGYYLPAAVYDFRCFAVNKVQRSVRAELCKGLRSTVLGSRGHGRFSNLSEPKVNGGRVE